MRSKLLLKGDMYEVNFGYRSKMQGYTTLVSDIQNLSEIALQSSGGNLRWKN